MAENLRSEAQAKLAEAADKHADLAMLHLLRAGERVRRPQSSEAFACVGFSWAEIVARVRDRVLERVPEARTRRTVFKVSPTLDHVSFHIYEDPMLALNDVWKEQIGCAALQYSEILRLLADDLTRTVPECKNRRFLWLREVRANGLRFELFFEDAQLMRAEAARCSSPIDATRIGELTD